MSPLINTKSSLTPRFPCSSTTFPEFTHPLLEQRINHHTMAPLPQGYTIQLDGAAERSPSIPSEIHDAREFLREACEEMDDHAEFLRANFVNGDNLHDHNYVGAPNGLIMTVLEAYNNHRRLILSPVDFEIPVLVLFNAMRYAKDAESRKLADDGRTIYVNYISHTDNPTRLAGSVLSTVASSDTHTLITSRLSSNIMPSLLSPANNDNPVNLFLDGSIPEVTLLGLKADWKEVGRRCEDIGGPHTDDVDILHFRLAMVQVFEFFVMSIENPTDPRVIKFWNLMCPRKDEPGWLAVFNYWSVFDDEGFKIKYEPNRDIPTGYIKKDHVSPGYCLLDVHVIQINNTEKLVKHVVGSVGTEFWSLNPFTKGRWNSVRPLSGSFRVAP